MDEPRRRTKPVTFDAPLRWNKEPWVCDTCGRTWENQTLSCCGKGRFHRRRVFTLSLGDWLDDQIELDALIDALDIVRHCDQLVFQMLTKRPQNFRRRLQSCISLLQLTGRNPELLEWLCNWLAGNYSRWVMIGVTMEDQKRVQQRMIPFLEIPARYRFISAEPLLEPIQLHLIGTAPYTVTPSYVHVGHLIHQVIVGGESGRKARRFDLDWARDIQKDCREFDMSFFFKQGGSNCWDKGGELRLNDRAGADISELPRDLQVQEIIDTE